MGNGGGAHRSSRRAKRQNAHRFETASSTRRTPSAGIDTLKTHNHTATKTTGGAKSRTRGRNVEYSGSVVSVSSGTKHFRPLHKRVCSFLPAFGFVRRSSLSSAHGVVPGRPDAFAVIRGLLLGMPVVVPLLAQARAGVGYVVAVLLHELLGDADDVDDKALD